MRHVGGLLLPDRDKQALLLTSTTHPLSPPRYSWQEARTGPSSANKDVSAAPPALPAATRPLAVPPLQLPLSAAPPATAAAPTPAAAQTGAPLPSVLLFFIAAVVWSQRRKLLDECREFEDVLRLFQQPKFDFWGCWSKARQIRSLYVQAVAGPPAGGAPPQGLLARAMMRY